MEKPIRYFAQKAGELSGHDEVLNSDLIESLPETGLTDRRASTGFPAWAMRLIAIFRHSRHVPG